MIIFNIHYNKAEAIAAELTCSSGTPFSSDR